MGREYHRQNEHYKPAHDLALLVLEGLGVEDVLAPAETTRSFVSLIDINRLFERFVHRILREALAGIRR
jgi:5-methylcytosine-specific restriction enzyme subunit McrC